MANPTPPNDASAADLAAAYAELQSLLVGRPEVTTFLQQVATLAASMVPNASCGITMQRENEVATVANSDDFALAVDEIQYGRGQGPCLQTLHSGHPVSVPDLSEEQRWGEYRVHALGIGVRSSLSLPLAIDDQVRGAMNLYATETRRFGTDETSRGEAFARQAATALTIVLRNADQAIVELQLREALVARAVIDQALGIVMAQRRVDAYEALSFLRESSQRRNRKLSDIAAELIQTVTGQPPRPAPPFTDPRKR